MITGREDVIALEVHDPHMVGQLGYARRLLTALEDAGISYISKCTNANTITHIVTGGNGSIETCAQRIRQIFPEAVVRILPVALISVLGTRLPFPKVVADATLALLRAKVDILALSQATRRVSLQVVIERGQSNIAQVALHRVLVEEAD